MTAGGTRTDGRLRALSAEVRELEARLREGGGADKIARQHKQRKLTARERIALLCDQGTRFLEIGLLVAYDAYEGQAPGSTTDRRWRQDLVGLYVQDDWTAKRNLTVNMGVRYEFFTTPHELNGREARMPDLQGNTLAGGPIFRNPSFKNVAPRTGFAWEITDDGKNALHGGAGLFFEPILSNVYRAYGNRTPPYYNLINPVSPTNTRMLWP